MTKQEYDALFKRFMSFDEDERPTRLELMHKVTDLFYALEEAKGRVYSLEETLDWCGGGD